jgi:DNA-binding transcriptional LysR family regulator
MDRLEGMAVFVAVADLGAFAAAARALSLSPPAVTRAVASLERRIGSRLLTRTTRAVRLTEAGRRYLADCRRILADIEEAEDAAAGSHRVPKGELVVTGSSLFGRLFLAPALPAFLERYPEVSVRALFVDRVVSLIEEGVDVAVRIAELPDSSMIATRVGMVRRVVVAAPDYLARHGVPRHPSELARHRLIAPTTLMTGDEWPFQEAGRPLAVRVESRLWLSTPETAAQAACGGFGLTRVPMFHIADDLGTGRLEIVLADFEVPPVPVSIAHHEGRRTAAKVRAFVDFMGPRLRAEPSLN